MEDPENSLNIDFRFVKLKGNGPWGIVAALFLAVLILLSAVVAGPSVYTCLISLSENLPISKVELDTFKSSRANDEERSARQ